MPLVSHIRIRLFLDEENAFGPGKADLLEHIRREGSISAAARAMGMSYRKAWLLVETMNSCFRSPLVVAAKGGTGGGGAELTVQAEAVLAAYREMQQQVDELVEKHLKHINRI
jgi:molybdate transport system regulatory protein